MNVCTPYTLHTYNTYTLLSIQVSRTNSNPLKHRGRGYFGFPFIAVLINSTMAFFQDDYSIPVRFQYTIKSLCQIHYYKILTPSNTPITCASRFKARLRALQYSRYLHVETKSSIKIDWFFREVVACFLFYVTLKLNLHHYNRCL